MPLAQKIDEDLKSAMSAKDAARLSTLRMLKSALKYGAIEKKVDALPDADAQLIIRNRSNSDANPSISSPRTAGRSSPKRRPRKRACSRSIFPSSCPTRT